MNIIAQKTRYLPHNLNTRFHACKTLFEYAKNNDTFLVADDNYEGIRVSFDENHGNGWFLLRQSLHDPILPINVESKDEGGCKIILAALYEVLQDFNSLDLRPLKKEI